MKKRREQQFKFRDGLSADELAAGYKSLQSEHNKEQFVYDLVSFYSDDRAQQFPGFRSSKVKGLVSLQTFIEIANNLRSSDINIQNSQRIALDFTQQLPAEAIYPAEQREIHFTPENSYMLETEDIYAALDFLRQQIASMPEDPNQRIRYFLMPALYALNFDNDNLPIEDHDFLNMTEKLGDLVLNATLSDKIPVIIPGILNIRRGHYINYFVVWNPFTSEIKIFVMDPFYEQKPKEKSEAELHYAQIIEGMLEQRQLYWYEKIQLQVVCVSVSVTQQLNDLTCGYFCVQNLEDVVVGRKVFICEADDIIFNPQGLSFNGNLGRAYDYIKKTYCYSLEVFDFDSRVRERWTRRFTGPAEARVQTVVMYPLKDTPTLDDAFDSPAPIEYDFPTRIQDQFREKIQGLIRREIRQLVFELRDKDGIQIVAKFKQRYEATLVLPTSEEMDRYTLQIKSRPKISVNMDTLTFLQAEEILGCPIGSIVSELILQSLQNTHLTALNVSFSDYMTRYHWREVCDDWAIVFEEFFAEPRMVEIVGLIPEFQRAEVRNGVIAFYAAEVQASFVRSRMSIVQNQLLSHVHRVLEEIDFPDAENTKTFLQSILRLLVRHYEAVMGFNRIENLEEICELAHVKPLQDFIRNCLNTLCVTDLLNTYFPRLKAKIVAEENLHLLLDVSAEFCCLDPQNSTVKYGRFLKNIFQEDIREVVLKKISTVFFAHVSVNRLALLLVDDAQRTEKLWQVLTRKILELSDAVVVPRHLVQFYTQNLAAMIPQLFAHTQQVCTQLEENLNALIELVRLLDNSLDIQQPAIRDFLQFLTDKNQAIAVARDNRHPAAFERFAEECRTEVVKKLNSFCKEIVVYFDIGSINPHEMTYCLRPFFARIFNIYHLGGNRASNRIIYDLNKLTEVDEVLVSCVSKSLFVLPTVKANNIPFLAQPNRVNYQNLREPTAGLLVSMIHAIDSEQYQASSWKFWRDCLKPLRTALATIVDQLAVGSTIDSIIVQASLNTLSATLNNAKLMNQAESRSAVTVESLRQMIQSLEHFLAQPVANLEEQRRAALAVSSQHEELEDEGNSDDNDKGLF